MYKTMPRAKTPSHMYGLCGGVRQVKLIENWSDHLTSNVLNSMTEMCETGGIPLQFYHGLSFTIDPEVTCGKIVNFWGVMDDLWGEVKSENTDLGKSFDEILGKAKHLELGLLGQYDYVGIDDWVYTKIIGFRFWVDDNGYREG